MFSEGLGPSRALVLPPRLLLFLPLASAASDISATCRARSYPRAFALLLPLSRMLPGPASWFARLPGVLSLFKALLLRGLCPTTLFENRDAPGLALFFSVAHIWSSVFLVCWRLGCHVPEDYDLQEGTDFVSFVECRIPSTRSGARS